MNPCTPRVKNRFAWQRSDVKKIHFKFYVLLSSATNLKLSSCLGRRHYDFNKVFSLTYLV